MRSSSSRVAAGLVTPVTGKRLAKSWRWDELYPAAVAYYRAFEREAGEAVFHEREALRLFTTEQERDEFDRRAAGMLAGLVRKVEDVPGAFAAPFGVFVMLLLALPTAATQPRHSGGGRAMLMALVLGLGFLLFDGIVASLGSSGQLPPLSTALTAPLLFAAIGFLRLWACEHL